MSSKAVCRPCSGECLYIGGLLCSFCFDVNSFSLFLQKMLRVRDEEFSLRERKDNIMHRDRRYLDDYDENDMEPYEHYKDRNAVTTNSYSSTTTT